jgi:hypothetical protein
MTTFLIQTVKFVFKRQLLRPQGRPDARASCALTQGPQIPEASTRAYLSRQSGSASA